MELIFNNPSESIRERFIDVFKEFSTITSEDEVAKFFDKHICNKVYDYINDWKKTENLCIIINDDMFYNKLKMKKFKDTLSANLDVVFKDYNSETQKEKSSALFITEDLNNRLSGLDQFIKLLEKQIKEYKEAKEKLELIHQLYLNSERL